MLDKFSELINKVADILAGGIVTILMTLAFIVFLIAIINFVWKRRAGDGKGLEQARDTLWWSVFALFVMVSVWGLVNFLANNLLGSDAGKTTVSKPQTNFRSPYKGADCSVNGGTSECSGGLKCVNYTCQ